MPLHSRRKSMSLCTITVFSLPLETFFLPISVSSIVQFQHAVQNILYLFQGPADVPQRPTCAVSNGVLIPACWCLPVTQRKDGNDSQRTAQTPFKPSQGEVLGQLGHFEYDWLKYIAITLVHSNLARASHLLVRAIIFLFGEGLDKSQTLSLFCYYLELIDCGGSSSLLLGCCHYPCK